jgi:orotidine-5'-phosphate decarboxylase
MIRSFGDRLAAGFAAGRHLCVGIDPHDSLLSDWGLPLSAVGAERMGRDVVAASVGIAAGVKPQIAFFERFGAAGYRALERVLADARAAEVPLIADVKRGDIGSSFAAYADAWLTPGSPLEADAMTVAAYQGFGTLTGALGHVRQHGKGVFVLAATSNPEARAVQTAMQGDGVTVAAGMVADAESWNANAVLDGTGSPHFGSIGVVLGATLDLNRFGIATSGRGSGPILPVLAPGFGFQGARIEDAAVTFGELSKGLLASESRSVLAGGAPGLRERISVRSMAIARSLGTLEE